MHPFLEALESGPLLFDGAMGSYLYERGIFLNRSYDELNLSKPELVERVHRDYLAAGAMVIETNTFGANRLALAKHGHSDHVRDINLAGARIAKQCAGDDAFVAGAVGPTGISFSVASLADRELALAALREQIELLCESGVDAIVLETFSSILELEEALAIHKEVAANTPVVAMMVFDEAGRTEGGLAPSQVAERLAAGGADIIGANCGVGPPQLYEVGSSMVGHGVPVAVMPNAGFPSIIDGRTIYVANPEHFGVFARRMLKSGIRIIGGCCGTTPDHTRAMLGAVRMMGGAHPARAGTNPRIEHVLPPAGPTPPATIELKERSKLGAMLDAGEFAVSVELTSPTGADIGRFAGKIDALKAGGVDIVNIADGPRATARMSNLAVCALAAERGLEPLLHICCRDRNYLGLYSHLLGAHGLGIRNLVLITGDPPKMGDYPFATPVYDIDSVSLLRMAAGLNAGLEPTGNELGSHTSFVLATGAEPAAADYQRELRRLEAKRDAGANLIMTQPVYNPRTLETFLDDVDHLGLPVLVGLLPLASHRNAEFLHNEVPGMSIPQAYRDRMAKAGGGPGAQKVGVQIAQEALESCKERVSGVYVMPPFNRVDAALDLLECVRGERWQPGSSE